MTGPDHYREAERLADELDHGDYDEQQRRDLALRARVHATLAQAAAIALVRQPADKRP